MADLELSTTASVPTGTTLEVTIYEDVTGDGSPDNSATVSVADGSDTNTVSGFVGGTGNEYWLDPRLSTTDVTVAADLDTATLDTVPLVTVTETASLTASVSPTATETARATEVGTIGVTASPTATETGRASEAGAVAVSASPTATELGRATERGSVNAASTLDAVEVARASETGSVSVTGQVASVPTTSNTSRTTTLTADANVASIQTLRPVFPDEQSLDVTWDYVPSLNGFASEWLSESSHIPNVERDGIGVTLGGHLETTISVFVQYDKSGDGTADVTSGSKPLETAYSTRTFEDDELFGADGYYRVVVQGLRGDDTINQLDIGPVHENL